MPGELPRPGPYGRFTVSSFNTCAECERSPIVRARHRLEIAPSLWVRVALGAALRARAARLAGRADEAALFLTAAGNTRRAYGNV